MSQSHDEQWCDQQLAVADRVLHYFRLRDKTVMERVHEVQLMALNQAAATEEVLRDFQNLLTGAAKYQACLLKPQLGERQQRCSNKRERAGRDGHVQSQHIQAHFPQILSQTQANVLDEEAAARVNTLFEHSDHAPRLEAQIQSRTSQERKSHSNGRSSQEEPVQRCLSSHNVSPQSQKPLLPGAAARRSLVNLPQANRGYVHQQPPQSLVAKELSEARLKVLNRRKIVAERKKNMLRPVPAVGRSGQQTDSQRNVQRSRAKSVVPAMTRSYATNASTSNTGATLARPKVTRQSTQESQLRPALNEPYRASRAGWTACNVQPSSTSERPHTRWMGERKGIGVRENGSKKGVLSQPTSNFRRVAPPDHKRQTYFRSDNGKPQQLVRAAEKRTPLEVHRGPRRLVPSGVKVQQQAGSQSGPGRSLHRIPES